MTNNIPQKLHFALKLNPLRPTFSIDMNEEERGIMQQHVTFWADLMSKGKVIVYGPILDPKGAYGFGVVEVDTEEEVKAIIANDPAARINKYEYYPMRAIIPKR